MRLSEAIRKGCEGTRQHFGGWGDKADLCALGAAARGYEIDTAVLHERRFDFGLDLHVHCPAGCDLEEIRRGIRSREASESLWIVIVHLNDNHFWTREQIADWVQAQEAIHGIGQDECHGPTGPCVREMGHEGDHVRPEPVLA